MHASDHHQPEEPVATSATRPVSITAAATRLGVSRTAVWWLIAGGALDAESTVRSGRIYARVALPGEPFDPSQGLPLSRAARLQAQVEQLTGTVDRLTALLADADRERAHLKDQLGWLDEASNGQARARSLPERSAAPESTQVVEPETAVEFVPVTARPNPMTHPVEVFPPLGRSNRDELLLPVRELFRSRQRAWWKRLPLAPRS